MDFNGLNRTTGNLMFLLVRREDPRQMQKEGSQGATFGGYLRFWGEDYPYLKTGPGVRKRWLPATGNSGARNPGRPLNQPGPED